MPGLKVAVVMGGPGAEREVSIARLLQHQNGDGAALHVVTHEARQGALAAALATIA